MSPIIDNILRMCHFCGKKTKHVVKKTVKYYESPQDFSKGTYIFSHTYTCSVCNATSKD